jgi:hypothetical protein
VRADSSRVRTSLSSVLLKSPVTLFVIAGETSRIADALIWEELRETEASGLVDVEASGR